MSPTQEEIQMWEEEIRLLRQKSQKHANEEGLIAFFGSSSFRMWDNISEDLAPHNVINLGFGGSSYKMLDYYFGDVFEFVKPSHVLLYAGDNDLGTGTAENDIIHSVNNLLTKLEIIHEGVPISIVSVKPSPERLYLKEKIESLNQKLEAKSNTLSNGHFIDIYTEMLDQDGNVMPELYMEDNLHMNSEGYKIWKQTIKHHLDTVSR